MDLLDFSTISGEVKNFTHVVVISILSVDGMFQLMGYMIFNDSTYLRIICAIEVRCTICTQIL